MSLIQAGGVLRRQGVQGFGAAADIESRENTARSQLESAKFAQKMNTIGTGGGIGAMAGLKNAAGAAKAAEASGALINQVAASSGAGGVGGVEALAAHGKLVLPAGGPPVGGSVLAGGTGGVTGGAGAAGSSGFLGTLGAIAAPIAIGLGVAYLISELFD